MSPKEQALSGSGMVRLGDKRPRDGQPVRVSLVVKNAMLGSSRHTQIRLGTFLDTIPGLWIIDGDDGGIWGDPDDLWRPIGRSEAKEETDVG